MHPERVEKCFNDIMSNLKLHYLDLLLVHWPIPLKENSPPFKGSPTEELFFEKETQLIDTWKAMESLVKKGKVKSIGCCNLSVKKLKELLGHPQLSIKPAVVQNEMNPYLSMQHLVDFCKKEGIVTTAYAPLGWNNRSKLLDDPLEIYCYLLQYFSLLYLVKFFLLS